MAGSTSQIASNHTGQRAPEPIGWHRNPAPWDADRLNEECGVYGVMGLDNAANLTALGLHALQHRGQEACGIVACNNRDEFNSERHMGLVSGNLNRIDVLNRLPGNAAIGHVRYSTRGEPALRNVQPLYADLAIGGFAVCHNGNLTNALTLREELVNDGAIFQSSSDTEVIIHLVARSKKKRPSERFIEALHALEGGYALVALASGLMIGARDVLGIRPLVIGELNGRYILASETCALDINGAKFVRDVEAGEVVVITENGIESYHPFGRRRARPCIFEYIYFSRPDSKVDGRNVYAVRKAIGAELARECSCDADVVVPIPDSAVPAAIGYAAASQLPFELGIIRSHYIGRTFIEPTQLVRVESVRLKHSANEGAVAGKRIVLIDDSVVRGTTSENIVQMMRDAGATEVHMRIASPPIKFPDYYGIDTPKQSDLLAATHTLEEMRIKMGADSLAFLSVDGLYRGLGHSDGRDNVRPQYTDHCFTEDYPTPLTDIMSGRDGELLLAAE